LREVTTHAKAAGARASALLMVLCAVGCQTSSGDAARVGKSSAAVGEPQDGFPNWDERVIHLWTNRARCDPQADLADCSQCVEKACYTPQPPLKWSYELARAARFHSANQTSCSKMSHDSSCTLVSDIGDIYAPGGCDGSASCACVGGGPPCGCDAPNPCTSTWARIGMFGASGSGENVAGGGLGNPTGRFYAWLHENYDHPDNCAFDYGPPTNGHRWNILTNNGPALGTGCAGSYCTQDFGGPAAPSSKLYVGVHHPQTGVVFDFRAHWYDPTGGAPQQAMVNVNGSCEVMTLERGVEPDNATYLLQGQSVSGCAHYYFMFKDSGGAWVTYPESGSFGINCPEDWDQSTRPDADASCDCTPDCDGKECGPDGCGGNCAPGCGADEACQGGVCECTGLACGSECCSAGEVCYQDSCCAPNCDDKECGTDGCGDSCGTCPGTLTCDANGLCDCEAGLTACGQECVNTQSDVDHCGGCDSPCVAPQVCASGDCADTCEPGQTDCDGSCADLESDPAHCGDCNTACSPGASCESATCTCTGGLIDCPGVGCTDVSTDPLNCGECGRECVGCADGRCPGDDGGGDGGLVNAGTDEDKVHGGCAVGTSGGSEALWLALLGLLCLARRRRCELGSVSRSRSRSRGRVGRASEPTVR
jgi:hypothetical protein